MKIRNHINNFLDAVERPVTIAWASIFSLMACAAILGIILAGMVTEHQQTESIQYRDINGMSFVCIEVSAGSRIVSESCSLIGPSK